MPLHCHFVSPQNFLEIHIEAYTHCSYVIGLCVLYKIGWLHTFVFNAHAQTYIILYTGLGHF